jgi:biotin-(acetyl-CoA carboxylase) ligase
MNKLYDIDILPYKELDSSQYEAIRLIEKGEAHHGHVITANFQSHAYGKDNRIWEMSQGDIGCTIILRPEGAPDQYSQLCYVAGLSIEATLRHFNPIFRFQAKWVNDIMV